MKICNLGKEGYQNWCFTGYHQEQMEKGYHMFKFQDKLMITVIFLRGLVLMQDSLLAKFHSIMAHN